MNEQRNTNVTATEDKTDTTEYDETIGTTINVPFTGITWNMPVWLYVIFILIHKIMI